jgi:hypothetical protein
VSSAALLKTLTDHETELFDPDTRRNRGRLEALLHPLFFEIGRSGRVHTRDEVLTQLPNEREPAAIRGHGFALHTLSEDVMLLTYQSAQAASSGALERHTLRASVWRRSPSGWQIVFHQATPMQPDEHRDHRA